MFVLSPSASRAACAPPESRLVGRDAAAFTGPLVRAGLAAAAHAEFVQNDSDAPAPDVALFFSAGSLS